TRGARMSSDVLILDQSWHQAAIFFGLAVVGVFVAFLRRSDEGPTMRTLRGTGVGVAMTWLAVNSLTWSARFDDKGVTVHGPVALWYRSASIDWYDMVVAEIIPCGWNMQGLHLVSRQGTSITLPLDQIPRGDISSVIARVGQHRWVRIAPDAQTFYR